MHAWKKADAKTSCADLKRRHWKFLQKIPVDVLLTAALDLAGSHAKVSTG
jgi:hypothetical protein